MSDLEKNLQKLHDMRSLKQNWNGYDAPPIPPALIEYVKEIIEKLSYQPFMAPTGRKTIQFDYELSDESYLGFEIYEDKISMLYVPQRKYKESLSKDLPKDTGLNYFVKEFIEKGYIKI